MGRGEVVKLASSIQTLTSGLQNCSSSQDSKYGESGQTERVSIWATTERNSTTEMLTVRRPCQTRLPSSFNGSCRCIFFRLANVFRFDPSRRAASRPADWQKMIPVVRWLDERCRLRFTSLGTICDDAMDDGPGRRRRCAGVERRTR